MRHVAFVALAACGFSSRQPAITGDADPGDATMVDAPPTTPSVKFVSLASMQTTVRPGVYGFEVTAVLRNELPDPITQVAATLTFSDGTTSRAGEFRWRDVDAREAVIAPQPQTIASGAEAMFRFKVDALPWLQPGAAITINGSATFVADMPLSATAADTGLVLPFAAINPPIVVNLADDEADGDQELCLREALARANTTAGFDVIVFDPAVFPAGTPITYVLDEARGELPITTDLVIDGHGHDITLEIDSGWASPPGKYGFRITSGNVAIAGLKMKNFGYSYPDEGDLSTNNCGAANTQFDGGAIRIDGGQLVLEGNSFFDPDVPERNCYAASVRLEGGTRHRVVNNTWTDQSMDAIYVDAQTVEIAGNVMNAGGNLAKVDECIFIGSQGGAALWIVNNICVDQEFSGVVAGGTDAGGLFIAHNTFVRNASAGVQRRGMRAITLRNNVYASNQPAAIIVDNNGTGFNVAFEALAGNALFSGTSSGATVGAASIQNLATPGFVDGNGVTRAALTPMGASPLVNSGAEYLDVNGSAPRRFNGTAPDRGAVEL